MRSNVGPLGGAPILALSIAAFPEQLPIEMLSAIFAAADSQVRSAGAILAGGHTIRDSEPKYGLAVVGTDGVDIVQSVRGRDCAVVGGVVDDRRKEVEREHEGALCVEPVDGGVIRRIEADEEIVAPSRSEARKQLLEPGCGVLRGAPSAGGEFGQPRFAASDLHRRRSSGLRARPLPARPLP